METPKIKEVKPLADLKLMVVFENGVVKSFDVHPYLKDFPIFQELLDDRLFKKVKVDCGGFGIAWNDEIDLSRYDIWERGTTCQ
ncbi:MAG: DUF2442 domain-containing protein [Clostridia bacterium]